MKGTLSCWSSATGRRTGWKESEPEYKSQIVAISAWKKFLDLKSILFTHYCFLLDRQGYRIVQTHLWHSFQFTAHERLMLSGYDSCHWTVRSPLSFQQKDSGAELSCCFQQLDLTASGNWHLSFMPAPVSWEYLLRRLAWLLFDLGSLGGEFNMCES